MLDVKAHEDITDEGIRGPHPRFSPAALEKAKTVLGIDNVDQVGIALGYSRPGFYRARVGKQDTRMSHAKRIAKQLNMPLDEVFLDGRDA